jgi:hypothetical protein
MSTYIKHHGVLGQKWGVRNGPPYPLDAKGQLKKINNLNSQMNDEWDYGVLLNGKKITDLDNMDWSKYRTIPIDVMKKEKIGVCWDFVNYQHSFFKDNGYPDETFMVVSKRSNDPDDILTHTFSIVKIGDKKYWVESAKWNDRGVHEVISYKDVINKFIKDEYVRNDYDIYKYNPDGMDNNLTDQEYFNRVTSTKNLVETSQIKHSDDELYHYGTKGMKWGVTNEEDTSKEQLNKSSLEEYKSKTSKYKEMRDKYDYKRSNYKSEMNQYLDDMNGITDRKALMRQIAKYNEVAGYYNSIDSKLKKLDGVIANREKIYDERMSKLLKKQTKTSKAKTKKTKAEQQTIKPTGKFYKPEKKKTKSNNVSDLVTKLQNDRK